MNKLERLGVPTDADTLRRLEDLVRILDDARRRERHERQGKRGKRGHWGRNARREIARLEPDKVFHLPAKTRADSPPGAEPWAASWAESLGPAPLAPHLIRACLEEMRATVGTTRGARYSPRRTFCMQVALALGPDVPSRQPGPSGRTSRGLESFSGRRARL